MKALSKLVISFYLRTSAIALCVCVFLIVVTHFLAGKQSPGIIAVARIGLRFWIPFLFALCIGWSTWTMVRIMRIARKQANAGGLTLIQYFELTLTEREAFVARHSLSTCGWRSKSA